MAGPQPRRKQSVRDAWRVRVTRTKTISDSVRVLLLYMATATDGQGRHLMDERGYWRQPQAETAAAFAVSDRALRRRIQDAVDRGWLARTGGGINGQVTQYRAQVVADQADKGCPPEPKVQADTFQPPKADTPCPPEPAGSPTVQADRGCPPYDARAVLNNQDAGTATARRSAAQQPDAATADEDPNALPRAVRQDGVGQADHNVTGGTGPQPQQASPEPGTGPRATRGGCALHPNDRTIPTPKRLICLGCERDRHDNERARRDAAAWGD
ncbi:hypothetical protein GCU67_08130 [Modestobacter muralis]|uniref:Helix-turn-helix domain-containing protein n=1 Tax=Modestobacter muralis TaxID=1608614 RepID=A0A6P0H6R7_9ACTN|nr:hypothetical protein [Modestobacter muralis]NEK94142.1 hypothetical protein [Modestobacter muralis]NEN50909.1 hypothetical protein [Modestobacter muralis]